MSTHLYLLRHTQSVENAVSVVRDNVAGYAELKAYVRAALRDPTLAAQIACGTWPSQEMTAIARKVRQVIETCLGVTPPAEYALTPYGCARARAIGRHLHDRGMTFDLVLCSPFRRAIQTRDLIAAECPAVRTAEQRIDGRLREKETSRVKKDFISFFALAPAELLRAQQCGEHFHYQYRPPEGESSRDVLLRVAPLAQELRTNHAGQHILIVAHKVSLIALLLGLEQKNSQEDYDAFDNAEQEMANGAFTEYVISS